MEGEAPNETSDWSRPIRPALNETLTAKKKTIQTNEIAPLKNEPTCGAIGDTQMGVRVGTCIS